MGNWSGVITNAGKNVLASWVEGSVLNITSAKTGTGTVAASAMMAQVALVEEKQTMSMVSISTENNGRKIKTQVSAPATGYTLNQIGIFGAIGTGTPVLLALYQNTTGVPIPSLTDSPDFLYTFFALLTISNTGSLTVNIDTSALVSVNDVQGYVDEALDEWEPEYTPATTMAELVSGENFLTAFGKIAKAVSSLINHTSNTNNPHSVTLDQVAGSGYVNNIEMEITFTDNTTATYYLVGKSV